MSKKLLDIEALYLYTQVVQLGGFTPASQRLKVPKPTLSRKIQALEASLGAQLLLRTTRSVRPTEIGREFYQRAIQVLAANDNAEALVQKTKREPQGLLRVSAGVEYGLAVISPLVSSFALRFPKVSVELDLTGRQVDLAQEGFDIAIRIGPLTDSNLSSRKLGFIDYGLFASPRYLKKAKTISAPTDLSKHPSLVFTRSRHRESWSLVSHAKEITVKTTPRLCSNNFGVLLEAAEQGLGIAFMPKFLASEKERDGSLTRILSDWSSEKIAIHAVYPEQRYLSPKVRAFVDHVVNSFK